jgi:hypothetical protein
MEALLLVSEAIKSCLPLLDNGPFDEFFLRFPKPVPLLATVRLLS